ncbi:methyl-accepting chemotaxis protein [Silicimonas sp. MF1-12-2]|uniref:methyl-accepting chemotaxis protein n=1 Tax=Silicimonas sp. MF1-12-2 TaxID=3384793 RepID=UPI0039B66619
MFSSLSASQRILVAFLSIGGLAIAAGAVILWSMFGITRSGEEVGARLAPLLDAAMEIKIFAGDAHLVMEEIMAGDTTRNMSEVIGGLERAQFFAKAIVDGGETADGVIHPSEDPLVRGNMREVLRSLEAFALSAEDRYRLLSGRTGVGTDADAEFDALYDDLTDRIATATEGSVSHDLQRLTGDARYLLAHGHLLVAEILGGDLGEDFGEATGSFDAAAERLGQAAVRAPELAGDLRAILPDLERLRGLAVQRYDRALDLSRTFAEADAAFDAEYDRFVEFANQAETAIRASMAAGLARQEGMSRMAVQLAAVAAISFLALIFFLQRWLDRSLGHRMKIIAESMDRITSGDLEVSAPDWGTTDEIGLLREKLEDLRQAFIRQKELERSVVKEREAAQAKQIEAERAQSEAERARMAADQHRQDAEAWSKAADSFRKDFSRVVDAARDGRFDQRIETVTGEADLDQLGLTLNEMLDSVSEGIGATIAVMSAVARGDLRRKMSGKFKGAFGDMQESVNSTLDELIRIGAALSEVSRDLASEVGHQAESSDRLSQRSTSQAASLEETNAAITSMSSMVKSTEADCSATVERVGDASRHASAGEKVVLQAIAAVEKIDENARKVSEFITVIDEISFQTNLLALNAGVEAARAGEAGKGFAVVAQEVRALAQRANEAASGIGRLIEESGRGVEEGVRLVTQTGEALREIHRSISQVAEFSAKIAESSREQSSGISEVSTVIGDLDRLTQQNASMAEEGTARSRNLRDKIQGLEMLVDFFKTTEDTGHGRERLAS